MKVRIHDLAAKELFDAVNWYNQLQNGLGKRFQDHYMVNSSFAQKTMVLAIKNK